MRPPTLAAVGWWTGSDRARRLPYLPRSGRWPRRPCGAATSFLQLALMRGLLGLAEPGNQPVAIRVATAMGATQRRGLFMSLLRPWLKLPAPIAAATDHRVPCLQFTGARHSSCRACSPRDRRVVWLNYRDPASPSAIAIEPATTPALPWRELWGHGRSGYRVESALERSRVVFLLFWLPGIFKNRKAPRSPSFGGSAGCPSWPPTSAAWDVRAFRTGLATGQRIA